MTRLLGLGLLALAATACQGEPDPNTESGTTDGTTTYIPDECGTGGEGSNDYCCQYNSNYCDSDTDTDTNGTTTSTTNTTIPDECGTGGGGSDYCCQYNSNYCDTDTATDTDPPPPDSDTDGRLPGCECILDEEQSVAQPTCGEQLCGVSATCNSWCDESPLELADPEALECALVALRDRTPGILTWSLEWNGGQYDDGGYVLINADGSAVHRRWGWSDNVFEAEAARLGELLPAEHFEACLANPDDLARLDCLRAVLDSTSGVCNGGWQDTNDGV